ncbi:hypothetical protein KTR9_2598 [Gordonia sp. KTR9]|nr:hypothetical protein KTR9_2598 [Gordonia sp. KTR9]
MEAQQLGGAVERTTPVAAAAVGAELVTHESDGGSRVVHDDDGRAVLHRAARVHRTGERPSDGCVVDDSRAREVLAEPHRVGDGGTRDIAAVVPGRHGRGGQRGTGRDERDHPRDQNRGGRRGTVSEMGCECGVHLSIERPCNPVDLGSAMPIRNR